MLKELILKNRSYRRFNQSQGIPRATLEALVELARLTPSAANKQPLKYFLSCAPETNALIFPTLAWAGYLPDWPGPSDGERPAAYIVMLGDKELASSFHFDDGIAAQTILLGAVEKGLGGCMIASIQRERLRDALQIPWQFEILLVLALGEPKENVVIEAIGPQGNVRYWRDTEGTHHVPKRDLKDLIINPDKND